MRIAIIHANDGTDTRIGKTARSLAALGHEAHFIGWDRRPEVAKELALGGCVPHVMTCPTPFGRVTWKGQARYAWHIVRTLARLRPRVVCCVNEDCAVLLLPFRGLLYSYLVCDIFDALADRLDTSRWPVRCLLGLVTEVARGGADRLIATDQARFGRLGRHRRKSSVIENVPEDPGDDLARALPSGPIKVYVAGTLLENRGLKEILSVAEQVPQLEIVSAGWPYDAFSSNVFVRHPRVTFHGIVTSRQSLQLAAQCDAVFAFYEPGPINHLYASPNKVYDAMSVGRPVLINSETRIARWVEGAGVGWCCPYHDVDGLRGLVGSLARHRGRLPEFAGNARAIYVNGYTWGCMEGRLRDLYATLGAREVPARP